MLENLRELVKKFTESGDLNYENPDTIYNSTNNAIAFLYFIDDNSLYYDEGETHPGLAGDPEVERKMRYLGFKIGAGVYWRKMGIVNGRLSTSEEYWLVREGFPGVVAFWDETVRNQEEIKRCLKRLLKEGLIQPNFLCISPDSDAGLVIDIIKDRTKETQRSYSSEINRLLGIFHSGTIEAKQHAFAELEKLGQKNPEDEQLKKIINALKSRLPASIKKSAWVPVTLGPGSGLEKYWGAKPEDLEKTRQNLIRRGIMKLNPITNKYECKISELTFKEWLVLC